MVVVRALRFSDTAGFSISPHDRERLLAPFQYLEIIGATIFGYFVFGDTLDATTIIGVVIIIGSGLYIFHREALHMQDQKKNDKD